MTKIYYSKVDTPRMVDETQAALLADVAHDPIFRRGSGLVRLNENPIDDEADAKVIRRKAGSLVIREIVPDYLAVRIAEAATFVVITDDGEAAIPVPLPTVRYLLAAETRWRFPWLDGIVEAPTLDLESGTILSRAGYDPATGLWYDPRNLPPIPAFAAAPTYADAVAALDVIRDLLKEFPFDTDLSFSVAVAAILTAIIRRVLPTAPGFLFDAPQRSSGKTLLADLIGIIASGRAPGESQWSDDNAEQRKNIGAILMAGDLIVKFDNCIRPIGGPTICSVITARGNFKDRILGVTERMDVPANAMWIFTGNNITVKDDMASRVVRLRLDAKTEFPEQRKFERDDLAAYALERRGELIHAALTILRAHIIAGLPGRELVNSRFKEWSTYVAGALAWLGMDDPAESRMDVIADDPVRESRIHLFEAWREKFGDKWKTAKEIYVALNEELAGLTEADGFKHGGGPSSIAARLKTLDGQIIEGMILRRSAGTLQGKGRATKWRLEQSAEGAKAEADNMAEARADFSEPWDDVPARPSYAKPPKM